MWLGFGVSGCHQVFSLSQFNLYYDLLNKTLRKERSLIE